MVHVFLTISAVVIGLVLAIGLAWPPVLWSFVVIGPLFLLGVRDALQRKHAVLRNFPLIGHFRYLLEMIRPEINQYFIESNTDGAPFDREHRSLVYQRSKRTLQTLPFGTLRDVYQPGYEWINHSLAALSPPEHEPRITIGAARKQAYPASLLNISAMSFGSLSSAAIEALNGGAKLGGFYHNTGEGGISPYHERPGGDLCWQIGTGYFGCRTEDGRFDPHLFQDRAASDQVKLIEIKLSQGAKPGHGGILPAAKVTPEIAKIRHIPLGKDVISPPAHSAFDTPKALLDFVDQLRELSGDKPVGIKLCLGDPAEFLGLCRAMHETGQIPDFITIDGGEGGTGAAPLEFSDRMGAPLTDGLILVHNALIGFGLREHTKVIAAGKIISGFDMAKRLAAGADICSSARGFMFAIGCIQARRCNSNHCPVGVATQKKSLVRGLDVTDKRVRVANYHEETVDGFLELIAAAGLAHPDELRPYHIHRRIDQQRVKTYADIYEQIVPGDLIEPPYPIRYAAWMDRARSDQFICR